VAEPQGREAAAQRGGAERSAGTRSDRERSAWRWVPAYAAATFLAFPHPVGERVLDLGLLFAWLSPLCLLRALDGLAPGRAARRGFAASLLAHAAILHWIYVVTVRYGHAPPLVGVIAPVGLAAYVAAFGAGFAGANAWLAARGLASPLAVAALWTAFDHLRSFLLTGFPWATLGYAQHASPALLGLASYTGVYGLSFATALGAAGLDAAWRDRKAGRRPGRAALAALAAVAALHAAGLFARASGGAEPGGGSVRVAVLQGNIDQGVKWSREWFEATLGTYVSLTREAAAAGAEVVVWPETAVPAAIEAGEREVNLISDLARDTPGSRVGGAVGIEGGARLAAPDEGDPPRVYDSAFFVTPAGEVVDRYDKSQLVPFGEYVPFQDFLGRFLRAVARGIATTGVTPGAAPRAVEIPLPGPGGRRLTAGVPICYELLFPDLVRRFVRDGAELLLAITNDAWYGHTGAPYQFLAMTALRSAETGVWTARAANTGVSAIIDGHGRVRSQTRIFERAWLVADVPRRSAPEAGTFYVRHGDWFAGACWIGLLGLAARGIAGVRRIHG
jgi:apolipoprotein N-acyltransferase